MPRRKELKSIADGVLSSFISRNNDVNGYWGIGKLLNLSIKHEQKPIEIDLLKLEMKPSSSEFDFVIRQFSNLLKSICESKKIPLEWIKLAAIEITSFLYQPHAHFGQMAPHRLYCQLLIIDDLGNYRTASKDVWCRFHSPATELKSGREYENEI